jgi:Arc/MetJ-type ribon-helix-helix transcriptional regulator
MSTLSVPLSGDTLKQIEALIQQGVASNKADLVRKAIDKYIENQVVESILKASKEPRLSGDLDELAKKFK